MSLVSPVTRLVAREFVVEEGDPNSGAYPAGFRYIYLQDPETGTFYEPKPGWEVIGEDLADLFQEVLAHPPMEGV